MTRPTVIAAIQAPTLLNRLATSTSWNLVAADFGDTDYREADLLHVPRWDGTSDVSAVLVTSPGQWHAAQKALPFIPKVWVHHTNPATMTVPRLPPLGLAFFHSTASHWENSNHRVFVIRPAYVADPIWTWKRDTAWTMFSRMNLRHPDWREFLLTMARRAPPGTHTIYGEDAPGGFLETPAREALLRSCSGYLSALPRWTGGCGLAEHEAFAAGCPVIGGRFGDVGIEMPDAYTALSENLETRVVCLQRVLQDEGYATMLSEIGMAFVSEYRRVERMNRDVAEFVEGVRWG